MKKLMCGNILDNPLDELFSAGEKASIFYSDPPWGEGNFKYWETMNKEGVKNTAGYNEFLNKLFSQIKRHSTPDAIVLIEMGNKWIDLTQKIMIENGIIPQYTLPIRYQSGSKLLPHTLIIARTSTKPVRQLENVVDTYGFSCVDNIVSQIAIPGEILCDPCTGKGLMGMAAIKHGMIFFGNEFNPKRLETAIFNITKYEKKYANN